MEDTPAPANRRGGSTGVDGRSDEREGALLELRRTVRGVVEPSDRMPLERAREVEQLAAAVLARGDDVDDRPLDRPRIADTTTGGLDLQQTGTAPEGGCQESRQGGAVHDEVVDADADGTGSVAHSCS